MKYLTLLYLIINATFFWHGKDLRSAQEWCYQFSSIILIISSVFYTQRQVVKSKFNLWLGVFVLWFMVVYLAFTLGWSILLNVFLGFGVYLTIIKTLKKEDTKFLIKGLSWVGIGAIGFWALQFMGFDLIGQVMANQVNKAPDCSFFGIKAALGMYLAALLPLVLSFSWIGFFLFIPIALAISTGAYMGAVGACLFFLWFRKRIAFWISLPIIIIGALFFIIKMDGPTGMYKTRLPMWGMVIQDSFKTPALGHGLDSFREPQNANTFRYYKQAYDDKTVRVKKMNGNQWMVEGDPTSKDITYFQKHQSNLDYWDNCHNLFIQIFYELGLGGLFLLGMFIYQIFKRFRLSRRDTESVALMACLLSFGIFSLTQFPFHLSRIANLFPVTLGLFYLHTED